MFFCRNRHLSTVLYICLVLFIYFGTVQGACLKPSGCLFGFYFPGYLSLVILPSTVFVPIFPREGIFRNCVVNILDAFILPRLIHRNECVNHLFLRI